VTEPWPRLPRKAVESPSLEIFQPRLDAVLCSLLWVTLLGQGVGLGDPQPMPVTLATFAVTALTRHGHQPARAVPFQKHQKTLPVPVLGNSCVGRTASK